MTKKVTVFLAFFFTTCINSYSQFKDFNLSQVNLSNGKTTRIFVTALWCSPCMGKYKVINQAFKKDTGFNNIVVFDASGFKASKLFKIEPDYYDSMKSFLIPFKYYNVKGLVVTNLPSKALKKFIDNLKITYPQNTGLDDFWYGDMLLISPKGVMSSEKLKM